MGLGGQDNVGEQRVRAVETGSAIADALVVFIELQPGMSEAMLVMHCDDGSGHCTVCTAGGQSGHLTWPCQTQMAAAAANAATKPARK
jgi:hypothetical protein